MKTGCGFEKCCELYNLIELFIGSLITLKYWNIDKLEDFYYKKIEFKFIYHIWYVGH